MIGPEWPKINAVYFTVLNCTTIHEAQQQLNAVQITTLQCKALNPIALKYTIFHFIYFLILYCIHLHWTALIFIYLYWNTLYFTELLALYFNCLPSCTIALQKTPLNVLHFTSLHYGMLWCSAIHQTSMLNSWKGVWGGFIGFDPCSTIHTFTYTKKGRNQKWHK